jgi:hypothetical protein
VEQLRCLCYFTVQSYALVFLRAHNFFFSLCFIPVSAEVQYAMKKNPEKLFFGVRVLGAIFYNAILGNVNFGLYGLLVFAEVEGDDIGIIVVLQVLAIDFQKFLITDDYVIYSANLLVMVSANLMQCFFEDWFVQKGDSFALAEEGDFAAH